MDKRIMLVLGVVAILVVASALSGCTGTNSGTSPTTSGTSPTTSGSSSTSGSKSGSNADVPAVVSGNTITISGTKSSSSDDQNSTEFQLDEGAYLLTFENTGSYGNIFTATLDEASGNGVYLVSLMDTSGSEALVVGDLMTPAGKYHLNVGNGGTYKVTITKPESGEAVPMTMTASKGQSIAKAIQLNPGEVKLSLQHDVAPEGTTMVQIYDLKGNQVLSDMFSGSSAASGEKTGTVVNAGVYIVHASFSYNTGGKVTVSQ